MQKNTILIIDDDLTYINYLVKELTEADYKVIYAKSGKKGIEIIQSIEIDIILLDIHLPEGRESGFEICNEIKKSNRLNEIPIIFLTVSYNLDYVKKGFDVGGVDYIVKTSGSTELLPRIKAHIRDYTNTKALKIINQQLVLSEKDAKIQIEKINSDLSKNNIDPLLIVELKIRLDEKEKQLESQQEIIKHIATKPITINISNEFYSKIKEFNQNITYEEAENIKYYFENLPFYKKQELKKLYLEFDNEQIEDKKLTIKEKINLFIEHVVLPFDVHIAAAATFEILKILIF